MVNEEVKAGFEWLFGRPIPAIKKHLEEQGYTPASGSCKHCGGVLYDVDNEVVCGMCSTVIGADGSITIDRADLWDDFDRNRPRHWNSNEKRCVGGFPWKYDWVEAEDIDEPVSSLSGDEFYQ